MKKKHKKMLTGHDAVLVRLCRSINHMTRRLEDLEIRIDEATPKYPEFTSNCEWALREAMRPAKEAP